MARSMPVPKTIKRGITFYHTGPGRARTNPPSAFFKADTKTNSPDTRTGPTAGTCGCSTIVPGPCAGGTRSCGMAGCRRTAAREKNGGRVLFLAMTDPAAHPAFLAADFAAAFTSATTGHAFSSGLSNRLRARRSHDVHGYSWREPLPITDC